MVFDVKTQLKCMSEENKLRYRDLKRQLDCNYKLLQGILDMFQSLKNVSDDVYIKEVGSDN